MTINNKSPPLYLYPLMFASAIAAIIIIGWMIDRYVEMNGG